MPTYTNIKNNIQGDLLNWHPLKYSKLNISCKLTKKFSKCLNLYRDLVPGKNRGIPVKLDKVGPVDNRPSAD